MAETSSERGAYHHGDLRSALIAASLALIDEGGVQNLSLRKAAKRAGVSPGAPYHHFKNRAALMAAIAAEGFELLGSRMSRSDGPDAGGRLCAGGEAYVQFAIANPAYFRVMFRPELANSDEFPELKVAARTVFEGLVQRVVDAQDAGAMPAGDHEAYVMLAWSTTHGLASLMIDGPVGGEGFDKISIPPEKIGEVVVHTLEAVLRGAAAHQRAESK